MCVTMLPLLPASTPAHAPSCCPPAAADVAGVVGLAVLKQPRVGSTWVKKELNALPGVHLEFEPLTDGAYRCPADFTNAVMQRLLREPLRCVNRKSRAKPCYWTKQNCSADALFLLGGIANKSGEVISGFLIHHVYVPALSWPTLLAQPRARLVVLRRTNLVKRTVSNMLRVAEEDDEPGANASDGRHQTELAPAELVRQTRLSMLSFVRMPQGVRLDSDDVFLLLYEDLQAPLRACRTVYTIDPLLRTLSQ